MLGGRYPTSSLVRTSPSFPGARPGPSPATGWSSHPTTPGNFPCCCCLLCTHAVVITPADPLGARFARFPGEWQPSPSLRWVGSALGFSRPARRSLHITACVLTEPPNVALFHRRAGPSRYPCAAAPIATGWSDSCRVGFAPTGRQRLSTAHSEFP